MSTSSKIDSESCQKWLSTGSDTWLYLKKIREKSTKKIYQFLNLIDTLYDQLLLFFVLVFAHSIFEFKIFHDFLTQRFGWNENLCETVAMVRISMYHSTLFCGVVINSHLNKFSSNFVFCHSIVCSVHDFHFNSSCSSSEFSALKSRNLCYENDEAVTVNEFTFFIAFKLNHFNNM